MATLQEIRLKHYISRKQLANQAGVSESTIVRMENPQHKTTNDVAKKVLETLSSIIGETVTIETVEGLNLYNVMRDRRQRTKTQDAPSEEVA